MVEKFYALPDGAELTYHSPTLDKLVGRIYTKYYADGEYPSKTIEYFDGEKKIEISTSLTLRNAINPLKRRRGWEWFDSIRD